MGPAQRIGLVILLLLGGAAGALAVRIADHYQTGGDLTLELGRTRLTRLDAETIAALDGLTSKVFVTYTVTAREAMPSQMRHVERRVTDLLEAMRAHAPRRLDFQIVDPETNPELAGFAARRKIAPFRVRSVAHDAYDERTVWSALSLSYGAHPDAVLSGIGPEKLPFLQQTLVGWLKQLERPRRPVIALVPRQGFAELAEALGEKGELVEARIEDGQPLPEADLLVWMRPRRVTDAALRELDRFLERGGSVLVAGSRLAAGQDSLVAVAGGPALQLYPSGEALDALLPHFGLRPRSGLFLDARCDSLDFNGQNHEAPFLVRCIAPNQDFHSFPMQPNGTLLFTAPTPLALDDETLRAGGWNAEVLATTSDKTWTARVPVPPEPPIALADMQFDPERAVAKQPLIVGLRHDDPWRGRLIACATTTPFEDGLFRREHVAHPRLLDSILRETISDERLVVAGALEDRVEPLPPMDWAARAWWRGLCVFLLPGLVGLAAVRRGVFELGAARALGGPLRWVALGTGAALMVLAVVRVAGAFNPRVDATSAGLNRLAPQTEAIAARAGELGPIRAELYFSERERLPPPLRAETARLRDLLGDLARAGAALEVTRTWPEDLDPAELAALEERGVRPFQSSARDGDVTTVRRFHASLVLARGDEQIVLEFPDARAFEQVEFRLAFALWQLNEGRRPHIAFASDVPRLSPAEAYEHFQQKGLFAPKGTDVYSLARATLQRAGFQVTHVNPREPVLPDDVDLLVWMQPRRSIELMLELAVRYLCRGGRMLLAAQHFNIQSRQYRGGDDFAFVYWPQPQTPDVEHLYFPELSLELVREVLFDTLSTRIDTETQITGRSAKREFDRQTSALPFLIRASAANYAPDSPFTTNLGDQAFVWGNYLRWDEERLDALGLTATPLITTTENTWSFDWSGGWLPAEVLEDPPATTLGRLPLAVLVEGTFPKPEKPLKLRLPSEEEETEEDPGAPWPAPAPGKLAFFGGSELFKDHRLYDPDFRGDHLLWNAACALALEPELVAIATRRFAKPGFDYVPPETRLFWRGWVLAAGPLALLLLGAAVTLARRKRRQA